MGMRLGGDGIKTSATSYEVWGGKKRILNYSIEELTALCDETHRHLRFVSMHTSTPEGIKHAINAGADVIEHCGRPDDEGLAMILEKNIITTATLAGTDRPKPLAPVEATFDSESPHYERRLRSRELFMKKYKAGVKIAMGTDTCHDGRSHPFAARGIAMLVEYGMTPMDAIVSSTKIGAEACDLGDELGTLEKEKLADIILVDGDPLKNIQVLMDKKKIEIVMKGGEVLIDRRLKT